MGEKSVPTKTLSTGRDMPVVGFGTVGFPTPTAETFRSAVLDAIGIGYRHFDSASLYRNEQRLGEALAEALSGGGLVGSREELFVTTKLWIMDAHRGRVIPALKESLRNLQLEYVDLYLLHWPMSLIPHEFKYPIDKSKHLPIDMKAVWEEMEQCQKLGLAKSIGVSNFSCKKLDQLLAISKIPPAVNQVELHPIWQQKKLLDFCKERGITVTAYSPLGGNGTPWGTNQVMECNVLKEIAMAREKSIAQISLRWIYQQGATLIVKSFKKERMVQNIDIFDWQLSEEELHKISQIPQCRGLKGEEFVSENGPFKSIEELWDGEV